MLQNCYLIPSARRNPVSGAHNSHRWPTTTCIITLSGGAHTTMCSRSFKPWGKRRHQLPEERLRQASPGGPALGGSRGPDFRESSVSVLAQKKPCEAVGRWAGWSSGNERSVNLWGHTQASENSVPASHDHSLDPIFTTNTRFLPSS